RLEDLYRRAVANGVRVEKILPDRLRELEPNATGIAALHSPDVGIVDFKLVAQKLRDLLIAGGVEVRFFAQVHAIDEGGELAISTDRGVVRAHGLINCGGLYCDEIARSMGLEPQVRIIPFRGEYYFL